MASTSATNNNPWPLYDLFLDVPHPAASSSCPPPFLIPSPLRDDALMEELRKSVTQISRFAFPEHLDKPEQQQQPQLNRYDYYAMQNKPFQHFTFTLQLSTGMRLHGHVRRYLPPHLTARSRFDVGRRGERALVILTRADGADLLYAAILKSIEAISSQQAALPHDLQAHAEPQKFFLHELVRQQQQLARIYQSRDERGKPLIANLEGLELGTAVAKFKSVDSSRFILPTCLLHKTTSATDPSASQSSSSILPLLRCVGVAHALRILSALLSERRVVMISSSPTRLAACSHAATAMLAQGLLHWQHLFIPVLPPHLWPYLAAPYPYLIGILSTMASGLDKTDGLGEVLVIQLDTNSLETRGMEAQVIAQRLPDLFQQSLSPRENLTASSAAAATPTEWLGHELVELLKSDKKAMHGESAMDKVGETAAKATKAVKSTFMKLRNKGRQYLQKTSFSTTPENSTHGTSEEPTTNAAAAEQEDSNSLAPDYIYTEACHNQASEEEARIAFTTFFLCMFGNMRWYLAAAAPGQVPQLDRERFLQQKRSMGEGEGTPIWPLLQNFVQTQMLAEFAKARIEEVWTRQPVTRDAPLFLQCAHYHRQHNIDFGLLNVRKIVRQVAESHPSRLTGLLQTNARRMAMSLTSNRPYEGDYGQAVAQLVEQCRESSSILFDVMSVIWLRLRDCRGMQWKHGYQALQILRNLLYHGPLAVIAEATDGLDKIRALKYYENMRSQIVQQVRTAASNVYNLLVDRALLFRIRRVCANRRLELQQNSVRLQRNRDLRLNVPFRNNHAAMNPNAQAGTVVSLPPVQTQQVNLLDANSMDIFGSPTEQPPASTPVTTFAKDMLGLFDTMVVPDRARSTSSDNPFNPAPTASAVSSGTSTPLTGSAPPSGRNSPIALFQPTIVPIPSSSSQEQASAVSSVPGSAIAQQPGQQGHAPQGGMPQQQGLAVSQQAGQQYPPQVGVQQQGSKVTQQPYTPQGGLPQQQQQPYTPQGGLRQQQGSAVAQQQQVYPPQQGYPRTQPVGPPQPYPAAPPDPRVQVYSAAAQPSYPAQHAGQPYPQAYPPQTAPQYPPAAPPPQQHHTNLSQFDPFAK